MIPDSIWDGEVRCATEEEAQHAWCSVVARGHIVERLHDDCRDRRLRVVAVIVEHPDLEPGQIYALFMMGMGVPKVYRTTVVDVREALQDPGVFNLA